MFNMPSIEKIGISAFKTGDHPFNGQLFSEKEDFVVHEIEADKTVLDTKEGTIDSDIGDRKDFLVCTLVKKGTSTQEALRIISKENHLSIKRFGYFGNKDKNAVTAQSISVFKGEVSKIKWQYKNFFLKDFRYSDAGCKIGALYGNRFTVRIRNFAGKEELDNFLDEIRSGIPNFYGPQHFGSSALNIDVSKNIIKRDFRNALVDFLLKKRDESISASDSRERMSGFFSPYILGEATLDQTAADALINSLPGFFYQEKNILRHLTLNKNDFIGAFRLVPKYFRLMILQSVQAYVFNLTLSEFIKKGEQPPTTIPTIGHDLMIDALEKPVRSAISAAMEKAGIPDVSTLELKEMPEVSLKTFQRESLVYPEDIKYAFESNDLALSFTLKKGAYATVLLLEMFKRLN